MSRILSYLVDSPWAIQREAFETIVAIAERELNDPSFAQAMHMDPGEPHERTSYMNIRDRVGLIEVSGPLFRRANLFSDVSGATSTELLAQDLREALRDSGVREVILQINSPGGEVSGIDELAELIQAVSKEKRVTAHVSGLGASAAYWLASAAHEIVATPSSMLGSIGAVLSLRDYSERDEKRGIRKFEFVSSVSPNKNPDPDTAEGRDQIQKMVDDLGAVFVQTVARYRGVTTDHVLENYGQGAVLIGQEAVEAGMADRIATLESVIAEAERRANPTRTYTNPRANYHKRKELTMEITAELILEEHPKVAEELGAKAFEAGRAEALQETDAKIQAAVEAERERISEIQALHAPGLDDLRAELIQEGVSVEAASKRVLAALAERAKAQGDAFLEGRAQYEGKTKTPGPSPTPEVQGREEKAMRILNAGKARQTA